LLARVIPRKLLGIKWHAQMGVEDFGTTNVLSSIEIQVRKLFLCLDLTMGTRIFEC
jgi:hypothetical protein